jgi:peptidoglycan/LPS O-acetylase OafA/YrhL
MAVNLETTAIEAHQSRNVSYLESLDILRGLAVLMVFFAHSVHGFTRGLDRSLGDWLFPLEPYASVLAEGHVGVALFMVMSAFLFAYGCYGRRLSYGLFLRNRLLRIAPMYVFVLLLGAYTYSDRFTFLGFLASLGLFSNTKAALDGGMFTILLWTISAEFVFYLLFPLLHYRFSEGGYRFLLLVLVLAISCRVLAVGLGASARDFGYYTIFGRIDQFLMGMIAAYLIRQGRLRRWSGKSAFLLSLSGLAALHYCLNRFWGGWLSSGTWKVFWPTLEGLVVVLLVISAVQGGYQVIPGWLRRHFCFVGAVSYSIYLLHMPVLAVVQKVVAHPLALGGSIYAGAVFIGIVSLLPVLLLSSLTFFVIEAPFMSLRSSYKL